MNSVTNYGLFPPHYPAGYEQSNEYKLVLASVNQTTENYFESYKLLCEMAPKYKGIPAFEVRVGYCLFMVQKHEENYPSSNITKFYKEAISIMRTQCEKFEEFPNDPFFLFAKIEVDMYDAREMLRLGYLPEKIVDFNNKLNHIKELILKASDTFKEYPDLILSSLVRLAGIYIIGGDVLRGDKRYYGTALELLTKYQQLRPVGQVVPTEIEIRLAYARFHTSTQGTPEYALAEENLQTARNHMRLIYGLIDDAHIPEHVLAKEHNINRFGPPSSKL